MGHRLEGVAILIICLFAFSWQTIKSLEDYYSYPISTSMNSVPFGQGSQMAAMALCVPYNRLRNNAYANMTIMEIRSKVFTVHDVVDSCRITLPNLTEVSCFDVTRVRTFTDGMCHCFGFFMNKDLKVPPATLQYDINGHLDADLIVFKLKIPPVIQDPGARFWAIKLFKQYQPMTLKRADHSKKWFLPETYKILDYSFDFSASNFLPAPYQSSCYPYHETKFRTRANAIDHCIVENFKTSSGSKMWPPFVYASSYEYDEQDMDRYASNKSSDLQYLASVIQTCIQKYPFTDCRQRIYSLDLKSHQYTNKPWITGVKLVIEFFPPTGILIETTPSISLMDAVNSIGGIASIWMGVSCFMPILSLSQMLIVKLGSRTWEGTGDQNQEQRKQHNATKRLSLLRSTRRPGSSRVLAASEQRRRRSRAASLVVGRMLDYPSSASCSSPGGKMEKSLETMIYLLCVMGCIFEVKDVLMIYMENPFTSVYVTQAPEFITMPRLTICRERRINESKLRDKYPHLYRNLITQDRSEWSYLLTIQQLLNTSSDPSQMINMRASKFVHGSNLKLIPLDQHFTTRKLMNFQYTCFRTLSPGTLRTGSRFESHARDLVNTAKWADIVIEFENVTDEIDLYVHYESNFHLDPGSLEKHVVRLNRNLTLKTRQTIFFQRTRRVLFANHFLSNCIDYNKHYGSSKTTMIQHCMSRLMVRRFNELPQAAFVNKTIASGGVHFTRNESRVQEIRDQCHQKFHLQDCDEVFIETKVEVNHVLLRSDERYAQNFTNTSYNIILYPPGTGYLEIHQVLRFSPIGLFAFCGGVIGAWTGLSFLHAKNSIHAAVKFFRARNQRR